LSFANIFLNKKSWNNYKRFVFLRATATTAIARPNRRNFVCSSVRRSVCLSERWISGHGVM